MHVHVHMICPLITIFMESVLLALLLNLIE